MPLSERSLRRVRPLKGRTAAMLLAAALLASACAASGPDSAAPTSAAAPAPTTAPLLSFPVCERDGDLPDGAYDLSRVGSDCDGWRVGSAGGECTAVLRAGEAVSELERIVVNPAAIADLGAALTGRFEGCALFEPFEVALCGADRENPNRTFEWRARQDDEAAARDEKCGPRLISKTCPPNSENPNLFYRYSSTQSRDKARLDACGPNYVTAACPPNSDNPNAEYRYEDTEDPREARREACGQNYNTATCPVFSDRPGAEYRHATTENPAEARKTNCEFVWAACPDDYEKAGKKVSYWPVESDKKSAFKAKCGKRFKSGNWKVKKIDDPLYGEIGTFAAQRGRWVGTPDPDADRHPEMGVECRDDVLKIWVRAGGYILTGNSPWVRVEYKFGSGDVISKHWFWFGFGSEPRAGTGTSTRDNLEAFVPLLRRHESEELLFRIFESTGAVYGVAKFDLSGITLRVDPVLKECGW